MSIHLVLCVDGDVVGLCHCTPCSTEGLVGKEGWPPPWTMVDMVHLNGIVPMTAKWHESAPHAITPSNVGCPPTHPLQHPGQMARHEVAPIAVDPVDGLLAAALHPERCPEA